MTALRVRPAAVAGTFYPADPDGLRRSVADSFANDVAPAADAPVPKALIAPHAGVRYSGPIAASAYARLAPARTTITRVVLLGPSHRVWLRGIAVPSVDAFDSPLGRVPVDRGGCDTALAAHRCVHVDDRPHAEEHSLEVHLPFLHTVLERFSIVPLVVGDTEPRAVAAVVDALWGGEETLIVVSTDLSHYLTYVDARVRDERTARAIVAARHQDIGDSDACGCRPLRGLLDTVRRRGMTVEQIDLRSSGDTSGDRSRVVGYGAFTVR